MGLTCARAAVAVAILGGAAAGSAPGLAVAQEAAPAPAACAAMDAALPPALAAWPRKHDVVSARNAAGLGAAALAPGHPAHVALHASGDVAYPLAPAKPAAAAAHGGLLRLVVAEPGTYRVALSSGAWIDVVRDGQAVASAVHSHGPACSTIHKLVDFPLTPGAYVLQISGDAGSDVGVLVAKAP